MIEREDHPVNASTNNSSVQDTTLQEQGCSSSSVHQQEQVEEQEVLEEYDKDDEDQQEEKISSTRSGSVLSFGVHDEQGGEIALKPPAQSRITFSSKPRKEGGNEMMDKSCSKNNTGGK